MRTFLFSTLILTSTFAFSSPCHQKIGAFDIGSGSTKAFAALVDTCKKIILKPLYEEKMSLKFKEELIKSSDNTISDVLIQEASLKILNHIEKMKQLDVKRISAVATSVFRTSANGSAAAQKISKITKIPIKVLSHEDEAFIGAQSALSQLPQVSILEDSKKNKKENTPSPPIIIWDIGGGSMQMWSSGPILENKEFTAPYLYTGKLASVDFKEMIVRDIQKKDPKLVISPNPIGAGYQKAVNFATEYASANIPDYFKKNAKTGRWLGIGGVLATSVQKQVSKDSKTFTLSDLEKTLIQHSNLKDSDIDDEYKSTYVSNLALVLGFMKALGIQKVETFNVSLAHGWIYHQIHLE